jgi:hypothetical protein
MMLPALSAIRIDAYSTNANASKDGWLAPADSLSAIVE